MGTSPLWKTGVRNTAQSVLGVLEQKRYFTAMEHQVVRVFCTGLQRLGYFRGLEGRFTALEDQGLTVLMGAVQFFNTRTRHSFVPPGVLYSFGTPGVVYSFGRSGVVCLFGSPGLLSVHCNFGTEHQGGGANGKIQGWVNLNWKIQGRGNRKIQERSNQARVKPENSRMDKFEPEDSRA